MKSPSAARIAITSLFVAVLAACGGGGGGEGDGGGGGGGGGPTPPSEATTGIAAPTRALGNLLSDTDKARRLVTELNAARLASPGLVAGQRMAALAAAGGTQASEIANCAGSGTVWRLLLTAPDPDKLDYRFNNCADGEYIFGTGGDGSAVATREANTGSPYKVTYEEFELTGPGIAAAPANKIGGEAACKVAATLAQCVTKPLQSELRAGYDAAYAVAPAAVSGTFSCDCFAEMQSLVISFSGFGATSGTARVFATDGYVDVTRKTAGLYDVTVVHQGGTQLTLTDVQPL